MCVNRATVGRGIPVRADSSMLPSMGASASKASSTTSPLASVVANAASPALSASTDSAVGDGMKAGWRWRAGFMPVYWTKFYPTVQ